MNKTVKIILGISFTLLSLSAIAFFLSYYMLIKPHPEYNGEYSVNGIENNIEIYRDEYAIPYIFATTDYETAFALGYVHAQERLFQMDIIRRAGQGRLSEVLGTRTIAFDKMFKTLGLFRNVVENYDRYNPDVIKILEYYSNGVNAFIESHESDLQIEFDVLGYSPEKWKPEHSLLIVKLLAFELNISWWTDVSFAHLIQKLGAEKVKDVIPDYPENGTLIISEGFEKYVQVPYNFMNVHKEYLDYFGLAGTHIGSNSWIVNGEKSESGKVIIANDPHLQFTIPGKWYFAVLRGDKLKAEGFTIPGAPVIVIGKNENIAWALTNVMADDCDFYAEKLDEQKENYLLNNKWVPLKSVMDTIIVKDSADVVIELKSTHRGPLITEAHPYIDRYPNEYQDDVNLSMRWTALDFSDELYAIMSVNKASNWNEFKDALSRYTVPGQNFVYGDKDGNIGYVCGVRLPLRRFKNSPTMIYDGTTNTYDWSGYVPFKSIPKLFNPPSNFISTANNKTIDPFPYHISNIWEPPSRIDRINELLNSKDKHSIEDFKNYQYDFYSKYAESIVPFILSAFENVEATNENLITSLKLLESWDYVMSKYSQTPTVFLTFYQFLLKNIYYDEMGEELFKEYSFMANVPYRSVYELLTENKSTWFDNVETEKIESRDDIIRESLVDALDYLEHNINENIEYWQWGNIHQLTFEHFFHGNIGIVNELVDIGPFEIGGDGTTIFNTEYRFDEPFDVKLGPSMRYVFDFADSNHIYFNMPIGQSGHILSRHYDDLTKLWLEGNYIKLNIDDDFIRRSNYNYLLLRSSNRN
ncbi:MAG: penicillin acylase family protein [Ignavibacteria bacterium]|jgi:penicillin amidase